MARKTHVYSGAPAAPTPGAARPGPHPSPRRAPGGAPFGPAPAPGNHAAALGIKKKGRGRKRRAPL